MFDLLDVGDDHVPLLQTKERRDYYSTVKAIERMGDSGEG
jgi:hypothetical protein